jgi:hypothetical protein
MFEQFSFGVRKNIIRIVRVLNIEVVLPINKCHVLNWRKKADLLFCFNTDDAKP